jgi:hypothetical protein
MSITAVVPVWNGRDLLARLLRRADAPRRGDDRGGQRIERRRSGSRATARRARHRHGPERGLRAGGESRHRRGALREDRDSQQRRRACAGLLAKLSATPAWFATGKILDARRNGLIDGTFDLTCRGGTTWRAGSGRADGPLWSAPRPIWSAPWTAALYRADVFRKAGLLEERFESYLEDVDFGLRCAAHGISGRYVPEAIAWHRGSATLGRWHPDTVRRMARNQVWLAARNLPGRWWWPALVAQGLWGVVAARHGRVLAWTQGIVEGLRGFRRMRAYNLELPGQLRENERSIAELQRAAGGDLYWKLYLVLTNGGAK